MKQKYLWMLCISAVPVSAQAEQKHLSVCRVPTTNAKQQITSTPTLGVAYLEADSATFVRNGTSELSGSVIIQQNKNIINAQNANYNANTGNVDATGNVKLSSENTDYSGDSITYNLKQETGIINNAKYQVKNSDTHGKSKKITKINANLIQLENATYTTCSIMEPSWHLASNNIKLNNKTQVGVAKNITLKVSNVPIFYFPWISFSLNEERKSGILTPKISVSDKSGAGITIPYYFNLAPNYDATTSLSLLAQRGLKFDNEFRFKTNKSQGFIEFDFFPKDRQYNDEWRDYFNLNYQYNLNTNSKFTLKARGVSDEDYFSDTSDTLSLSSTSSLERDLAYSRWGKSWNFSFSAIDYQVFGANTQPYSKLPELKFNYQSPYKHNGLNVSLDSEATYFDSSSNTTGLRFDIGLKASKRYSTDGWYINPSLEYRSTQYSLKNNSAGNTLSRNLPTISLDSGMFFDRKLSSNLNQTLEPRLFYTYTPYEDQSNIPIFDTSLPGFSTTSKLFKSNRFSGKDRIGDTNQVTLSLTSRIQNSETNQEKLKASIGQIFYFSDRNVIMPGGTALTTDQSELAFELTGKINDHTNLTSTLLWDTKTNDWASREASVKYQGKNKRKLQVSYQHLNSELSEIDTSFSLPVSSKWTLLGRADYDIFNNRTLELLAGIEYNDCCWGTRFVARRYLTSDNVNYDNALFFEVDLKGLGSAGNNAGSILQEKIYGYEKN